MKITKTALHTFFLTLVLFSKNTLADDPIDKAKGIYTESQLNITIDKKHPEFIIKLKSNPTTGYSWFLREYNINLLAPVKHKFEKSKEERAGAPGYEIWVFRAKPEAFIVPQYTTLRFIYARPWQGIESSTPLLFRVSVVG